MAREVSPKRPPFEFHPVTPDRWHDLETLFGPQGAYGGCWCMWFRLRRKEWDYSSGRRRKESMKALVASDERPGLLAYLDGSPVGWVSLGPREAFPHLEHSRTLKRVDDRPVWSIVCFVVDERRRGKGVMAELLRAAVDYALRHGAVIVEAYPVEPKGRLTGYTGYTGVASTFREAGFVEVARPREDQLIMRYYTEGRDSI